MAQKHKKKKHGAAGPANDLERDAGKGKEEEEGEKEQCDGSKPQHKAAQPAGWEVVRKKGRRNQRRADSDEIDEILNQLKQMDVAKKKGKGKRK